MMLAVTLFTTSTGLRDRGRGEACEVLGMDWMLGDEMRLKIMLSIRE